MILRLFRLLVPLSVLIVSLFSPASAQQVFTVNNGADLADHTLNGQCSTGTATGGACTLRAAIQEANSTAAADTIIINVQLITLTRVGVDNSALNGDLDLNQPVTINGNFATVLNQTGERAFQVGATVTVNNLAVTGTRTLNPGGAFAVEPSASLTLNRVYLHHNAAGDGAAVFAPLAAQVLIENSAIVHNTGEMGAVTNSGSTVFRITNTTISNNIGVEAGGLALSGGVGTVQELTNVTITENFAYGSGSVSAGGMITTGDSIPTLKNTILANNRFMGGGSTGNCDTNAANAFISGGGNVIASTSACPFTPNGDANEHDPLLEPLSISQSTAFHDPMALSPALLVGQDCPASDQNSDARPVANCTAGAIEAPVQLLTTNGGFESGLPGWTVSGTGVKAKVTDPRTGLKHLEFKGATGLQRSISQKYDLGGSVLPEYVVVDLYTYSVGPNALLSMTLEFKRPGGEKVKLVRTLQNGNVERAPEDYLRFTYRLLVDESQSTVDTAPRAAPGLTSVTIRLIDKSGTGSKTFVDDVSVYLYGANPFGRSVLPVPETTTRDGVLPPPAAPEGFRGNN